jgi:hypothetical protein
MLNKYRSFLNSAWCFWYSEFIALSSWTRQHPHPLKPGTQGHENLTGTYIVEGTGEDCSKFNYSMLVVGDFNFVPGRFVIYLFLQVLV